MKAPALLFLVLVVPSAAAGNIISWTSHIHSGDETTWPAELTRNITRPHDWTVTTTNTSLQISVSRIGAEEEIGGITLGVSIDGSPITSCTIHVQDGAVGTTTCPLPEFTPGTSQAWNFTITGDPGNFQASAFVITQDVADMDLTVTTAIDSWIPFIIWGTLAFFFLVRNATMPALVTTVMAVMATLENPPLGTEWGILMLLLATWLHVLATQGLFPGTLGKPRDAT